MKNNCLLVVGSFCLLWLLQIRCTMPVSGVETTNGNCSIEATATTIEGTAPASSRVYMCSLDYIPYIDSGIGLATAADIAGGFQFSRYTGNYGVTVISPQGTAAAITITAPDAHSPPIKHALDLPGSISGSVSDAAADTLLTYLAGTPYYQLITGSRLFLFKKVPDGEYLLKTGKLSGSTFTLLKTQDITVLAGQTTAVGTIVVP